SCFLEISAKRRTSSAFDRLLRDAALISTPQTFGVRASQIDTAVQKIFHAKSREETSRRRPAAFAARGGELAHASEKAPLRRLLGRAASRQRFKPGKKAGAGGRDARSLAVPVAPLQESARDGGAADRGGVSRSRCCG